MSRLKEIRERYALSQRDLAEKAGIAYPTISRIETGKNKPCFKTIRKIAYALNVEPSVILDK